MSPTMGDEGRDLLRDTEVIHNLPEIAVAAVQAALREADFDEVPGLWVNVIDDRERALQHYRRELGSGAAALAQQHLKIANELMRMAGNAQHNSIRGFDSVATEVLVKAISDGLYAMQTTTRLLEQVQELVARGGWDKK